MSLKDILVVALAAGVDAPAFALADALAMESDADLCVSLSTALPEEPLAYEPTVVSGVWAELLARARADAATEKGLVEAALKGLRTPCALRTDEALSRDLGRVAAVHARYSDVTILTRPEEGAAGALRTEIIENVLYYSGRPALIVPPQWKGSTCGRNVVIAWDASREATRALAEARPFIAKCERVTVLTVDAKPRAFGHGEQPGLNIAQHLTRRGAPVEIRNADSLGRSVSAAIAEEATSLGADLLVMGAYAHSRLREMVFGGATRDLLHASPLPMLMAH